MMKAGKMYAVFSVRERPNAASIWTRVGDAFLQPDGSMKVELNALPLGAMHIRETGMSTGEREPRETVVVPGGGVLPDVRGFKTTRPPSVDEVAMEKLSAIGKLVKAVRFVKHAHTHHDDTRSRGDRSSYSVSEQTFNELMEALEQVEQGAIGINLKGGSAE